MCHHGKMAGRLGHSVEPPLAVQDALAGRRKSLEERAREVGLVTAASRALKITSLRIRRGGVASKTTLTSSVTVACTCLPLYCTVTDL